MPDRETDERDLICRLRSGDEDAFNDLVAHYHGAMMRVARAFVHDMDTSEEVVQEAWIGVLRGLDAFQGRSSLKSWIFAIVINLAKTRGAREARSIPFSALAATEACATETAVDPNRFLGSDSQWPGHWAQPPEPWGDAPEARLLQAETMTYLSSALDALPPAQRTVITLRDFAGYDAQSICNVLSITETNMRVLLHRARSKIRGELERYFDDLPLSSRSLP